MNITEKNLESIYKILYSDEYNKELESIYNYIAIDLKEKNIAKKLIAKIRKEIFS